MQRRNEEESSTTYKERQHETRERERRRMTRRVKKSKRGTRKKNRQTETEREDRQNERGRNPLMMLEKSCRNLKPKKSALYIFKSHAWDLFKQVKREIGRRQITYINGGGFINGICAVALGQVCRTLLLRSLQSFVTKRQTNGQLEPWQTTTRCDNSGTQ